MNTQKTEKKIPKEKKTLEERGLRNNSFFHVIFADDSQVSEFDTNWKDFGEVRRVKYQGGTKTVVISTEKIKHIRVQHGTKEVHLDVPDNCEVYQAVRSETAFVPDQSKQTRVIGRVVGLVQQGEVVEEIFINGLQDVVLGWRK